MLFFMLEYIRNFDIGGENMSKKGNLSHILLCFAVISLIEYLIFHLIYVITDSINEFALLPIRLSLSVFPITAAAVLIRERQSFKGALKYTALISLTRFFFTFLYSYFFLLLGTNLRSLEAISLAPISSLIMIVIYFLLILACYGIVRLVFKLKKIEYAPERYFPLRATDFKNPVSLGIVIYPLAIFATELVLEIISTVGYFLEIGSVYRSYEIIYMIFQYIFLLIQLIASVLLASLLSNKLTARDDSAEQ